jgi:hypothetical protein
MATEEEGSLFLFFALQGKRGVWTEKREDSDALSFIDFWFHGYAARG